MRKFLLFIFTLCVLGSSNVSAQQTSRQNYDIVKNLDLFNIVYKYLDILYVDTLNVNETVGAAIKNMLATLDPYTEFYPEDAQQDMKEMLTGKFAGIGAMLKYHRQLKETIIAEPTKGMPADEAKLKKGDIIISVDGKKTHGMPINDVTKLVRGEPGTVVNLKIKRPTTGKMMNVKITRRTIQNPALSYYGMIDDQTGYVSLTQFIEDCAKEVRRAVIELKKQGMQRMILDLRGNGGGAELEAVGLVSIFVPKGTLVVTNKGKHQGSIREYRTTVEPIDTVMPLVVMTNGYTASSSEITCGALQDLDRAVILGTRTYGKGLVQTVVDLPYNSSMKLTISKYYTPSGRCIQARNFTHGLKAATEHIPDSLTREFRTANGRIVKDGGGIMPDTIVKADTITSFVYYLLYGDSTECLHDFAVDYIAKHPTIPQVNDFQISDADYERFCERVAKSGFTYNRETERMLKQMIEAAKFEGYYNDMKEELDRIEKKLVLDLQRDLQYNKEEVKYLLADEIVPAYYYQEGGEQLRIKHDTQVQRAAKLLANSEAYRQLLTPKK